MYETPLVHEASLEQREAAGLVVTGCVAGHVTSLFSTLSAAQIQTQRPLTLRDASAQCEAAQKNQSHLASLSLKFYTAPFQGARRLCTRLINVKKKKKIVEVRNRSLFLAWIKV